MEVQKKKYFLKKNSKGEKMKQEKVSIKKKWVILILIGVLNIMAFYFPDCFL